MRYELQWRPHYGSWDGVMLDDLDQALAYYERLAAKTHEYRHVELYDREAGVVIVTTRERWEEPDR